MAYGGEPFKSVPIFSVFISPSLYYMLHRMHDHLALTADRISLFAIVFRIHTNKMPLIPVDSFP